MTRIKYPHMTHLYKRQFDWSCLVVLTLRHSLARSLARSIAQSLTHSLTPLAHNIAQSLY